MHEVDMRNFKSNLASVATDKSLELRSNKLIDKEQQDENEVEAAEI